MKILILGSKEYPLGSNNGYDPIPSGGIERYIENLVEELEEYKDVEILIMTRKFPGISCREKFGNKTIYRVKWIKGLLLRNPTFNFSSFLRSSILKFDIIFCVGVIASIFGVILSTLKGVPVIHHFSGIHHKEAQYKKGIKRMLHLAEIVAYRFCGDMIFLSEENENKFKETMKFLPRRVHIIPTGININHFSLVPRNLLSSPLRLIAVGRLVEVKGIQDFIEALIIIRDKIDFIVSIVGEGPYRKVLERVVEGGGIKKNIVFEGNVPPNRVVDYLRGAHIYVLPSYSEGLPQSLLEAMACGLACIVSDIGLPIKHGETGIVVPPSDANAIAQAIIGLAACPSLMETLGKNGRNYIFLNHSRQIWAASIYKLSRTLILRKLNYRKLKNNPESVNDKY